MLEAHLVQMPLDEKALSEPPQANKILHELLSPRM